MKTFSGGERLMKTIKNTLALLFLVLLFCGILPLANWLRHPLAYADKLRRSDAIVVLSGGVIDAETLDTATAYRLLHGLLLLKQGYALLLILSGGNPVNPAFPDADVMARVARVFDVSASAVIVENQSNRTWEQGQETAHIAEKQSLHSVILVTSPEHMYRARRVFQKAGLDVISAPPGGPERGYGHVTLKPWSVLARIGGLGSVLYEYGAVVIYWWRGWI